MSSSSTPTTTLSSSATLSSDAAATTTSSGSSGGGFGAPSSSLYLFTFLATLFLLLFVSSAIVLRSFFLRRRFRRRIEEAIAAGVLQTPTAIGAPGSRRKLDKPLLWDTSLAPARDEKWEHITPIAAMVACADPPAEDSSPAPSSPDTSPSPRRTPFSINRILRRSPRERAPSTPVPAVASAPSSPNPATEQSTNANEDPNDPLARAKDVQVAVLISMPNPHHPVSAGGGADMSGKGKERSLEGYWEEEEEGVPDVVIGVAHIPMQGEEGRSAQSSI